MQSSTVSPAILSNMLTLPMAKAEARCSEEGN